MDSTPAPAGTIATVDQRGPYRAVDLAALASASLADAGGRLPIDENHATDRAAPEGRPSPARGWIVALEARADGLWGKVEWTEAGRALMAAREYRFTSPVIRHLENGTITAVLRTALTNTPNLRGITALNSEKDTMDLLSQLRAPLGLRAHVPPPCLAHFWPTSGASMPKKPMGRRSVSESVDIHPVRRRGTGARDPSTAKRASNKRRAAKLSDLRHASQPRSSLDRQNLKLPCREDGILALGWRHRPGRAFGGRLHGDRSTEHSLLS